MKNYKKLWLATVLGLTLPSLMACSTRSGIKERLVEVPTPVFPPSELLRSCKIKAPVIETTGDLAKAYSEAWWALERCDADKEGLREWVESY